MTLQIQQQEIFVYKEHRASQHVHGVSNWRIDHTFIQPRGRIAGSSRHFSSIDRFGPNLEFGGHQAFEHVPTDLSWSTEVLGPTDTLHLKCPNVAIMVASLCDGLVTLLHQ